MPSELSEAEVMNFLIAVEDGEISLCPELDPQDVYAGNVPYAASNGWHITIFNDANEWDYIDEIRTPDGREVDFDDLEQMPLIRDYSPSDEIAWKKYGIPGYCQHRCQSCGTYLALTLDGPKCPPFLCESCRPRS